MSMSRQQRRHLARQTKPPVPISVPHDIGGRLRAVGAAEPIRVDHDRAAEATEQLAIVLRAIFIRHEELVAGVVDHRTNTPEERARHAYIESLDAVIHFGFEVGLDHTQLHHLIRLRFKISDIGDGIPPGEAFVVRGGGSSRVPTNVRRARAFVATAVWALVQTGMSIGAASEEIAKALRHPERLSEQNREAPAEAAVRVRNAYEQAVTALKAEPIGDSGPDFRGWALKDASARISGLIQGLDASDRVARLRAEARDAALMADMMLAL